MTAGEYSVFGALIFICFLSSGCVLWITIMAIKPKRVSSHKGRNLRLVK